MRDQQLSTIEWLLEGDPAIRWQVMRDLTGEPEALVAAERSRVATEGWGLSVVSLLRPDGRWGDGISTPQWSSTLYAMLLLRDLGLDPRSDQARTAIGRVRDQFTWGEEFGDLPFFEGEVEPCINGGVLALGGYFGETSERLRTRLLSEQLEDGGWNCEAERGSVRSSFHTTICVLEGLLAYEQATGFTTVVTAARARAHEYLLVRRLFRRRSTGAVIRPEWAHCSFPTTWHYDVLRGLDYLRRAGVPPDDRMAEAVELVANGRGDDGRWRLAEPHSEPVIEMEGGAGAESRWNTLRALRVLAWYQVG